MEPTVTSRLIDAVEVWAKSHPTRNAQVLSIGNGDRYSPVQIVAELKKGTAAGRLMLRILEHAADKHQVEDVIRMFERRAKPVPLGGTARAGGATG